MPGTLIFKPLEANLTRNTEMIGKMDPYCQIETGSHKVKGQVCKKGGKHPMWEDAITVPISDQATCHIEVKDKDILIDDHIGAFDIDVTEIQAQGTMKKWYPLFHRGKPAGEILMETIFTPSMEGIHPVGNMMPTGSNMTFGAPLASGAGAGMMAGPLTSNPYGQQSNLSNFNTSPSLNLMSNYQAAESNTMSAPVSNSDSYAKEALLEGVNPLNVVTTEPRLPQTMNVGGNQPIVNTGSNVGGFQQGRRMGSNLDQSPTGTNMGSNFTEVEEITTTITTTEIGGPQQGVGMGSNVGGLQQGTSMGSNIGGSQQPTRLGSYLGGSQQGTSMGSNIGGYQQGTGMGSGMLGSNPNQTNTELGQGVLEGIKPLGTIPAQKEGPYLSHNTVQKGDKAFGEGRHIPDLTHSNN